MSFAFSAPRRWLFGAAAALLAAAGCTAAGHDDQAVAARPAQAQLPDGDQVAVLAGGCFWGMEAVFEHVRGVRQVEAGYSGGAATTAHYDQVSDGDTGHAESVRIVFDPHQVSYAQLLRVYFAVAHDPTERDRQGPDQGSQYRSEIFILDASQAQLARQAIAQLQQAHAYPAPIVTRVEPLRAFYSAEAYHQHYAQRHPDDPYILYNDAPKVAALQRQYPALYQGAPALAGTQR